jgi:hypothetical protein
MRDLKTLREGWDEKEAEAVRVSSALTVQKGIVWFFASYQTFASHFKETEAIFGPERRTHLIELQRRLQRLAEWQQTHDRREFMAKRYSNPETVE